jgi:hypothetical protein
MIKRTNVSIKVVANIESVKDSYKIFWLFLRFGGLSDQHAEQGRQEMFAPHTGIVHALEKAQVQGQLLL